MRLAELLTDQQKEQLDAMTAVALPPHARIPALDGSIFPTANPDVIVARTIGQHISELRQHRGLSLADAARGFNTHPAKTGTITEGRWRGWEQGDYTPTRAELINAARVLRRPVNDFLEEIDCIRSAVHDANRAALERPMRQPTPPTRPAQVTTTRVTTTKTTVAKPAPTPITALQPARPKPAPRPITAIVQEDESLEDLLGAERVNALKIGAALKRARLSAGLTLEMVAEAAGLSVGRLTGVEQGTLMSAKSMRKICVELGVDPDPVIMQMGELPPDIVSLVRSHPELIGELRRRFPNG